jgi:hypothetical protein
MVEGNSSIPEPVCSGTRPRCTPTPGRLEARQKPTGCFPTATLGTTRQPDTAVAGRGPKTQNKLGNALGHPGGVTANAHPQYGLPLGVALRNRGEARSAKAIDRGAHAANSTAIHSSPPLAGLRVERVERHHDIRVATVSSMYGQQHVATHAGPSRDGCRSL